MEEQINIPVSNAPEWICKHNEEVLPVEGSIFYCTTCGEEVAIPSQERDEDKCPECGSWLEVRAEQDGPDDFVMVAYCHGCGYTESE